MKRNFNIAIKNINNEDMPDQTGKFVTMCEVCLTALLVPQEGDDRLDGKKKYELVELAFKINQGDEADLTAEEIVMLKQRISKVPFNTHMITYRVHQFLEDK